MAKHVNWYLDGWEYSIVGVKGKEKRVLVYKGSYYSFNLPAKILRRLKAGYLLLTIAAYTVFLLFTTNGSQGGESFYSGIPCMLSIIPFIYLGMGIFSLLTAREKMTYRSYYASVKRITYSARIAAVLLGLCTLGETVYILLHVSEPDFILVAELQRLIGAFFCSAAAGAILFLHKKFPVVIINPTNDLQRS